MTKEFDSDAEVRRRVSDLIEAPPLVHDWGSGLTGGGLEGDIVRTLAGYLLDEFKSKTFSSIETGAGLSTLVFAASEPAEHIVVNPDVELKSRIMSELDKRSLPKANLRYETAFSEDVLPKIAQEGKRVDLALVDGGHGWPTVFVDFCYTNMMLREGGIMVIDDIPQFPCMQLFLLLKHQPGWTLEKVIYAKTAFFRKTTSERLMPDWGGQPYIMSNVIYS